MKDAFERLLVDPDLFRSSSIKQTALTSRCVSQKLVAAMRPPTRREESGVEARDRVNELEALAAALSGEALAAPLLGVHQIAAASQQCRGDDPEDEAEGEMASFVG